MVWQLTAPARTYKDDKNLTLHGQEEIGADIVSALRELNTLTGPRIKDNPLGLAEGIERYPTQQNEATKGRHSPLGDSEATVGDWNPGTHESEGRPMRGQAKEGSSPRWPQGTELRGWVRRNYEGQRDCQESTRVDYVSNRHTAPPLMTDCINSVWH